MSKLLFHELLTRFSSGFTKYGHIFWTISSITFPFQAYHSRLKFIKTFEMPWKRFRLKLVSLFCTLYFIKALRPHFSYFLFYVTEALNVKYANGDVTFKLSKVHAHWRQANWASTKATVTRWNLTEIWSDPRRCLRTNCHPNVASERSQRRRTVGRVRCFARMWWTIWTPIQHPWYHGETKLARSDSFMVSGTAQIWP